MGYSQRQLIFYTRYSDIELHPALLDESAGVWLDNFSSNRLDIDSLDRFLNLNKNVVLVSPELHGFEYDNYWHQLLKYLNSFKWGFQNKKIAMAIDGNYYPVQKSFIDAMFFCAYVFNF